MKSSSLVLLLLVCAVMKCEDVAAKKEEMTEEQIAKSQKSMSCVILARHYQQETYEEYMKVIESIPEAIKTNVTDMMNVDQVQACMQELPLDQASTIVALMQKDMLEPHLYYYVFESFELNNYNAKMDLTFTDEQQAILELIDTFEKDISNKQEQIQKENQAQYQKNKEIYEQGQKDKENQRQQEKEKYKQEGPKVLGMSVKFSGKQQVLVIVGLFGLLALVIMFLMSALKTTPHKVIKKSRKKQQ